LRASQGYNAITAYSQSKLANCMFTFALADRLKSQGQVRRKRLTHALASLA
jgi:NAD(P)-dependent dehydrogenase (short-subunit alcohol dehydrogenase family)